MAPATEPRCPLCGGPLLTAADRCARCTGTDPGRTLPQTLLRSEHAVVGELAEPAKSTGALRPGDELGRYRLIAVLGQGGMGAVWRAYDPALAREVALKLLRPELAGNAEAMARFQREARLSARLQHSGIVGMHDVGSEGRRHYLTMEFVDGCTFAAWSMRERERDPAHFVKRAVTLLAEAAEAVAYAHAQGVIHRDLKPQNVLIDGQGRARVGDFGLAQAVARADDPDSRRLTSQGEVLGTPAYMSPEQAGGETARVGPASDVWALGMMLYEILTGALPFSGGSQWQVISQVIEREVPPPSSHSRDVAPELEAVCIRALDKRVDRRLPGAAPFAADLRRWLHGDPVLAKPLTLVERLGRRVRRYRPALAIAAVATLVVLAVGIRTAATAHRERGLRAQWMVEIRESIQQFESDLHQQGVTAEAHAGMAEHVQARLRDVLTRDPNFGPALAWRGKVRSLLCDAGAAADFDAACLKAPEDAWVWLLRGRFRLDRYIEMRPLPTETLGPSGSRQTRASPETDEHRQLRTAALADFAQAEHHGRLQGEDLAGELAIGRGTFEVYAPDSAGWERALAVLSGNPRPYARLARALALILLRRSAAAEQELTALIGVWPGYAIAYLHRADVRLSLAAEARARGADALPLNRSAVADYTEFLQAKPDLATALNNRGNAWLGIATEETFRGEDPRTSLRQALADFDASWERDPTDPFTPANRAHALLALAEAEQARGGDAGPFFERSELDFGLVLKRTSGDPTVRSNRSACRVALGDWRAGQGADPTSSYQGAWEDAEAAVAGLPTDPDAWLNHGNAELRLARRSALAGADARPGFRRAVDDFGRALSHRPDFRAALSNRAVAWQELGEAEAAAGADPAESEERARADFSLLLDRFPNDPLGHYNRAALYRVDGDRRAAAGADPLESYARAITDLEHACALRPDDPEFWGALGDLHRVRAVTLSEMGQDPRPACDQALAAFDQAIRRKADLALAWALRANAGTLRAWAEDRLGGDALPGTRAVIHDAQTAQALNPNLNANRLVLCRAWLMQGQLLAAAGNDPSDAWRGAHAACDAGLATGANHEALRRLRGDALAGLAGVALAHGQPATDLVAAAVADLEAAAAADPSAWLALILLRRLARDFPGAMAGLDAAARQSPELSALFAGVREETVAWASPETPAAAIDLGLAEQCRSGGDAFGAALRFRRLIESDASSLAATDRQFVLIRMAGLEVGRDPESAWRRLDQAAELGPIERELLESEPAFASLRADPRFAALLAGSR